MYDLVIKNGSIVNGTGEKQYRADVCVHQGKIIEICDHFAGDAKQKIDALGKIVAPGFIDIHTHSDAFPLIQEFEPLAKLYQGVTLEITGNCGISTVPSHSRRREEINRYYQSTLGVPLGNLKIEEDSISDLIERVRQKPPSIHYGILIGHGTLRGNVMGFDLREPNPGEMEQMEQLLDRELARGAFGMSLGLIYPPSSFGKLEEIVALAQVIQKHNGILSVHMRSEGPKIFEALDEMLEVARRSGVHLQISHLKLMGKPQWGRAAELLAKIEEARKEGLTITCDQYPYNATSTSLTALCPKWAHDGGTERLVERLEQPEPSLLSAIRTEMNNRGGAEAVMILSTMDRMPQAHGKNLKELAELLGCTAEEAAARCLVQSKGAVSCNYFCVSMDDVLEMMKDKRIAVGSDGINYPYDKTIIKTVVHPRNFGTFPRFLQTVREHQLMPVEDAVYKMTGLPASILGLSDRGVLAPGKVADLTIFDEKTVEDRSTYLDSMRQPAGISHVIVEGVPALLEGKATGSQSGKILLHTAESFAPKPTNRCF